MAFNRSEYPADWERLRMARLAYADNCCEGTVDHPDCRASNGQPHPETGSKVVLTIAHLCQTKCGNWSHLRALCNRCHLRYDGGWHGQKARATRQRRKAAGTLFNDDDRPTPRAEAEVLRRECRGEEG